MQAYPQVCKPERFGRHETGKAGTGGAKGMKKKELQEIQCLRAVLERILRVMDEGLFVDYEMEKFGQIKYDKELLIGEKKQK